MTYYGGRALAASFRQVRGNTIRIAEEIPDSKYDFKPVPDCRTIGQTLVHIAFGPSFQLHIHEHGIADVMAVDFPALMQRVKADEAMPRSKTDIVALLTSAGERFATYLESLTEAFLAEPVAMRPGTEPRTKSRFEMLLSAKEHEMHHRGQIMVLQRMIGQTPHLTRQMQERMAQRAAAAPASR